MRRTILTLIFTLSLLTVSAQNEIGKCNIQKIKNVHENLNNLTYKIVLEFLYSFDKSCKNNVEYSEWSNEMLFKLIENSTDLYFEVLNGLKAENQTLLLNEIENPNSEINFQKIYNKIKLSKTKTEFKNQYLNNLRKGAEKSGLKITL